MTSTQGKGIPSERVHGPSSVNVDHLECPICRDLLWKPIACQACEIPFCSVCINQWLAINPKKCPNRCETYTERKCPPFVVKLLAQLQIVCFYQLNGCQEILAYEALEKHEIECGYQLKQCPGCQSQVLKKDFSSHKKTCELFQWTCKDCKLKYKASEASSKHTENKCLKKQLKRLKYESNESRREIEKLNSELIEIRRLNSSLTQEMITFEDLPSAIENLAVMPNSYKGLKWTKMSYIHELYATKKYPKSGYVTSFMPCGSLQIAYFIETASISTVDPNETFTLVSLSASAAWNDDLELTITAYQKSEEVNDRTVVLLFGRPQLISLQWKNVDKVVFKPSGGTAHSGSGEGAGVQVAITQLTIDTLSGRENTSWK